jgi:hypothetical protein
MATSRLSQTIDRDDIPSPRACLTAGCPCKDARIVSHRRAAFFAVVAQLAGETADRTIPAEPEWRIAVAF